MANKLPSKKEVIQSTARTPGFRRSLKDKAIEYFSRKFLLTASSLVTMFTFVWNDKPIGELIMGVTTILGLYGGTDVLQGQIHKKKEAKEEYTGNE